MDIAFCVNDPYVPYITVTIKSILSNHPDKPLFFYVLADSISNKSVRLLHEVVEDSKNASCKICLVDDKNVEGIKTGSFPKCIWYRVLLSQYLPDHVNTVLYLDADTLVLGDISPLFDLDLNHCSVAGCNDPLSLTPDTFDRLNYPKDLGYICSGVLLINLCFWRKEHLTERILAFARKNEKILRYPDQDAINIICRHSKMILPLKYGIMDFYLCQDWPGKEESEDVLTECLFNPRIVHFAGNAPWKKEFSHRLFHDDWLAYNRQLRHPVRRRYATKGWYFLKMIVWNTLHLRIRKNQKATRDSVLSQLTLSSQH